jgi:hypothetical protein
LTPPSDSQTAIHVFTWGNNGRRAELKGRRCIVEARGTMSTVLVRFLDTGERITTSRRALRRELRSDVETGGHLGQRSGVP